MKLRIAAAGVGLAAMSLIPATHAFGVGSPITRQQAICIAKSHQIDAVHAALGNIPPQAAATRARLQTKFDNLAAYIAANC